MTLPASSQASQQSGHHADVRRKSVLHGRIAAQGNRVNERRWRRPVRVPSAATHRPGTSSVPLTVCAATSNRPVNALVPFGAARATPTRGATSRRASARRHEMGLAEVAEIAARAFYRGMVSSRSPPPVPPRSLGRWLGLLAGWRASASETGHQPVGNLVGPGYSNGTPRADGRGQGSTSPASQPRRRTDRDQWAIDPGRSR